MADGSIFSLLTTQRIDAGSESVLHTLNARECSISRRHLEDVKAGGDGVAGLSVYSYHDLPDQPPSDGPPISRLHSFSFSACSQGLASLREEIVRLKMAGDGDIVSNRGGFHSREEVRTGTESPLAPRLAGMFAHEYYLMCCADTSTRALSLLALLANSVAF